MSRAGDIDFANDAAANPGSLPRGGGPFDFKDFSNKFMAGCAAKAVVAAKDFDVRVADTCKANSYSRPT